MQDKQRLRTYHNLQHWHSFRLRLFGEGILVGIVSGCVVGFFRYALHFVESQRSVIYSFLTTADWYYTCGWFALLLIVAYALQLLVQYEPMSAGSGIPQVKGVILGFFKMKWFSVLWSKLAGGILGIGAGLSLGREGPSIQLGAVAAQGVSRLLGRTKMEERYLITSGSSAGLAAAFNAPLAGVIFSLEELHRNFSAVVLLPAMAAAITATVFSHLFFGRATIFHFLDLPVLPMKYLPQLIILGLLIGFLGAFFNYCLLHISSFYALPIFKNTFTKAGFALTIAGILGFYLPEILGGGNTLIDTIAQKSLSLQLLLLLLAGKFIFTMLSYGAGTPGGFFLPMLVIGALSGSVLGHIMIQLAWLDPFFRANIIVFAMAAFFTASVRAPITGIILIMEMTGSFQHLFPLVIVSMAAYLTAEICKSQPIYDDLLERSLSAAQTTNNVTTADTRSVIEVSVCSGSTLDSHQIKNIAWPPHTLLVDIKRGGQDLIPNGETRILAGDFLYVLTDSENAEQVRKLAE